MAYVNSKKYGTAIQHYKKQTGDITFYITYKDINNKLKRLKIGEKSNGITEAFCNQKRIEILNKIRLGEDPLAHKKKKKIITLDDVANIYFKQSIHNKDNAKTYNKYVLKLKNKFGYENINSITTNDILKYQNDLIKEGLAPSTINFYIIFIGTLYNIAIEEKLYIGISPTKSKKIKKLKVDNQRERYLDIDDIKLLKNEIDDEDIKIFVDLSLLTGGRLETILNIQKKDINLINQSVTLKDLKNDSTYTGFLSDSFIEYITPILKQLKLNSYVVGKQNIKYATRTCQRKLQNKLNLLFNDGLDTKDSKNRVVIHTLRHTFASHLAINGTPIFTIQKLMNHKDIKQTMRYAKLAPNSGRSFVNELYK